MTRAVLLVAAVAACVRAAEGPVLPGSQPLTMQGDLSVQIHEAALREMDRKIADAPRTRTQFWHRAAGSPEDYAKSIEANRARFQRIIGLVDQRVPVAMERFGDDANPTLVAETQTVRISQVRWPVFADVHGEGLLLEPTRPTRIRGYIVAIPDADQPPEQLCGLAPGIEPQSQFARRLAENDFVVVVPTLLDRSARASGDPALLMTNETHREWIHRQAWMMGRSVIGYEVQKVLAAVDWMKQRNAEKIGVAGYGEGGLLAFYAAAADPRIDAALVTGYFKSRQQTWSEPLYRDVWGLLREFGDAEIASLIAPRGLVVAYREEPRVEVPPPPKGQKDANAPGQLTTPPYAEVQLEFNRIGTLVPANLGERRLVQGDGAAAFAAFANLLRVQSPMALSDELPKDQRHAFDPIARQLRQVRELNDHIQLLVRDSDRTRDAFFLHKVLPEFANVAWNYNLSFPQKNAAAFASAAKDYKRMFWEDILGKLDDPLPPLNPRTRLIYDEPKWSGYEVVLDTGGEGFAWGVLLLPKDLKPGERRPVVVCQHGRHGIPSDTIEGDKPAYHNFAARLAEQGFITLAPHNLYQKEEHYRTLARKGHTIGMTHWSVILRHHQQWLAWLESLPQVDPQRIGFYGLSFGGESAMRLPPLLDGYALSICSGDFNDWTRKVASTHDRKSFMFSDEWEIGCFNMGSTFSYAELSYLIFPRPFMVERGHHDGVALDPWVASEYAKTKWFYDQFGLGDRTAIEFFNGGHVINGQGTFEFLRRELRWPAR
jgi:dienelactone hydrolase